MILILFVTNTLHLQRTLKVFAVESLPWPFSHTDFSTNKWSKISSWETLKNPQGYSEKVQLLKQPEGCILECMGKREMIIVTGGSRIDSAFPTKAWWLNHPVQMSRKADKQPQFNDNTNFLPPCNISSAFLFAMNNCLQTKSKWCCQVTSTQNERS